jgi:hypothetical protein
MTAERQQFSQALALSAGVNLLLFLAVVWLMAVSQGLSPQRSLSVSMNPPQPAEVVIQFVPPPAENPVQPPGTAPGKVLSPDDVEDAPEAPPDSQFTSDRNLRAASETDASPGGQRGMISQRGIDHPSLDLRDSDFHNGDTANNRPPEPSPPPASPMAAASPPVLDTPPGTTSTPDAAPAFRYPTATALVPLNPKAAPAAAPPAPSQYVPGRTKTKSLGTITNQGKASVNARATAGDKFERTAYTAVEKLWRPKLKSLSGLVSSASPQFAEIEFEIDRQGHISNVKLLNADEANPVFQDCALSAIIEARLPPPPPSLFEENKDNLIGGRLRRRLEFGIY